MKKLLFVLLVLLSVPATAQNILFAPRVGLNLADMTNAGGDLKPGINIGLAGEYMLSEGFSIESGLFYSMQGTKVSESGVTVKMKNDYINIPVYAKAYLAEGFNVFAGPQFGFKVSEKVEASLIGVSYSEDLDMIEPFDFSIGIGFGYQFKQGLQLSANYNLGLTNTIKALSSFNDIEFFDDVNSKNNVIQLNVGWRF